MTDLPASWQTDPTGRHDHRYWDGARWTEHVADAGIAATDPYDEPAVPEPAAPEPEPAAESPTLTSGWAAPTQSEPAPTVVTPTPDATGTWGAILPPPDQPLAEPGPAEGDDGSGARAKRNILIGAAIVVVALVVAVLAIGGDDDDGSRDAVTSRIADSIRSEESGLSRRQADCIADVIVDDVGLDRVKDVDFDAETAPKGDVGEDVLKAYDKGVRRCAGGGATDATDGGSDSGAGVTDLGDATSGEDPAAEALGKLSESELKRQLAQQYKGMGLDDEQADCLGGKMAKALKQGDSFGDEAFGSFFDYVDECGVSLDDLGATSP